ncbi:MAG: glycosyltransferase family 4 protein [Flavobacteriaceae bacterium]|nr:glycosyltransferase family 4 protein [Flavobacteriaceae bacterium]
MIRSKIAIFSGSIPSSTFIERLIKGMADYHDIYLFGVVNEKVAYRGDNIVVIPTYKSHFKNLLNSFFRSILLVFKNPKAMRIIFDEAMRYPSWYERFIWYTKFLPIALYKPDILHLQWARDLDFYYFFKSRLKYQIILSLRGAHINYSPIIEPRIADLYKARFPLIDGFHSVSQTMIEEAVKYGMNENKVHLIRSPLPGRFFEHFTQLKPISTILKIVSVGRFHWIKGIRYALDACAELQHAGIDFEYTIVSPEGIDEESLFQIHQLNLQDRIVIRKTMSQHELMTFILQQDVMLLSSLAEGLANVVLEAMALGTLVVSTDCGGMKEVIINKETGWLIENRDSTAMAKVLEEIVNSSPEMLNKIRLKAHDRVKAEFNYDKSIEKFLSLYESCLMDKS